MELRAPAVLFPGKEFPPPSAQKFVRVVERDGRMWKMILRIASLHIPTQQSPIYLTNGSTACSLCGTNWIFIKKVKVNFTLEQTTKTH